MRKANFRIISLTLTSLFVCASASAQEAEKLSVSLVPDAQYAVATNKFRDNWEVSFGLGATTFYGNQEANMDLSRGLFQGFRTSVGVSMSVAKWFSPDIAMRLKLNGFSGKSIQSAESDSNSVKYASLQADALFNIHNMVKGYDQARFWNFIPYAGVGFARNFTHCRNTLTFHVGLLNTFRITERLKGYCDLSYNLAGGEFDNMGVRTNKIFTNRDTWIGLEVGVTYELGKNSWKHMVDLDDVEVVPWQETQREMKRLLRSNKGLKEKVNYLENQPKPEPVNTVTTVTRIPDVSIFFEMGISDLNHRGQLENIKKLVKIAQDEKRIITVTGFADSQTGNELLNEKLAARRADTIVKELLEMGVDSHQIRIVNGGGVNTLDIVPANRRVVVSLGGQYADPQVSE